MQKQAEQVQIVKKLFQLCTNCVDQNSEDLLNQKLNSEKFSAHANTSSRTKCPISRFVCLYVGAATLQFINKH